MKIRNRVVLHLLVCYDTPQNQPDRIPSKNNIVC